MTIPLSQMKDSVVLSLVLVLLPKAISKPASTFALPSTVCAVNATQ